MTRLPLAAFALAAAAALCPAAAQSTIRIEPRPFYGATVTLEEGVRVFRPLPPHKYVIINPGNRTPLNLSLYEERTSYNTYDYSSPAEATPGVSYGGVGFVDNFGRRHHRQDRHHRFHRRVPKRVH